MRRGKGYWMLGGLLAVLIALAVGTELLKQEQKPASAVPQSLVSTFRGDPGTSRAFTWHTSRTDAGTVVQIEKGAADVSFESSAAMTVEGETDSLELKDGSAEGVHKVNVRGLEPGTVYSYRVGSGKSGEWSETGTFETESAGTSDFAFIDVTDSQGVTKGDFALWGRTLDKAFQLFPGARFIVHNGDLTENPDDGGAWEAFFGEAGKWLAQVPLMPVTGNHEEIDKKADAFQSHFDLPDNGAKGALAGTSYSFDYGSAHFVVLDTESHIKDQAKWLKDDLSQTQQPWIIVALHRGPYGGSQDEAVLKRWVPLFDEYGVDLVLQGHNHEYVRSYPIRDGQVVEDGEGKGTVYVVPNASGAKFNEKKADRSDQRVHFQNNKQMFAGIRISGDRLTYQAYDIDGKLLDEFEMKRD